MSFRMFLGLQVLMFLVFTLLASELRDIEQLRAGVVLNFAVFYLAAMLVGFSVKVSPTVNALGASITFNLIFYSMVFLNGQADTITTPVFVTDVVTMIIFTVSGVYVGVRSRPNPGNQDMLNQ